MQQKGNSWSRWYHIKEILNQKRWREGAKRLQITRKNIKTTVKTWLTKVRNAKTNGINQKQTTVMGGMNS